MRNAIIELATGSNDTASFGSGVNKALNVEAKSVFEIKESLASLRKWAARVEKTEKAVLDLEKFSVQVGENGGDLEDGTDATWTVIDNESLIQFGNSLKSISVGFKLTPKVVRQARQDPDAFMARYRRAIAFDMARKEDTYIASVLTNSTTYTKYGGAATNDATLGTASIMTIELFETMIDDMKDRDREPTDFFGTAKIIGQLRRDARLLNNSDFSVAIKENGSTVTSIGDVEIHEIKGTTIVPNFAAGVTGSGTSGWMIAKEGAYGIVDFLKAAGASPVTMSVGMQDPTFAGMNYHRLLGQSELECKILDDKSLIVARVNRG